MGINTNKNSREKYYKVQNVIKNAKFQKYLDENKALLSEKVTFFDFVNRKNDLKLERLKNLKLKMELLSYTKIIAKDDVSDKELLTQIYSCAMEDLVGKITPEMVDVYNEIKNGMTVNVGEDIDREVYEMSCNNIYNSKDIHPMIHETNQSLMFSRRIAQIKSLKLENTSLENEVKEAKKEKIIIPLGDKILKK